MSSVTKPARRRNGRAGPSGASGAGSGGAGTSGAFCVAGRCLSLRKGMTLVAGLFFAGALINTIAYLHSGRTFLESFSAAEGSGGSLPNFALSSLLQLPAYLSTTAADVVETEEAVRVLEEPPPPPLSNAAKEEAAAKEEPKVRGGVVDGRTRVWTGPRPACVRVE